MDHRAEHMKRTFPHAFRLRREKCLDQPDLVLRCCGAGVVAEEGRERNPGRPRTENRQRLSGSAQRQEGAGHHETDTESRLERERLAENEPGKNDGQG